MTHLMIEDLSADATLDRHALMVVFGGFNALDQAAVGGTASSVLSLESAGISLFSPTIVVQNTFAISPIVQVANIFDQDISTQITNILNSVLVG